MTKRAWLFILASGAFAALVAWRASHTRTQTWYVTFVIDRSESFSARCTGFVHLAGRVLATTPGNIQLAITLLATGDKGTANEPVFVTLPAVPRHDGAVLEGARAAARRDSLFLDSIGAICSSLQPTDISALYLATRRALEVGLNGGLHDRRSVVVAGDLEETALKELRTALHQAPGSGVPAAVSRLDAHGASITLCGYASTRSNVDTKGNGTAPRDAARADRIREVWMQLFTDTTRVSLHPYCETVTLDHRR